jgi:UDP-2-acetamido-3-amino-2,3-dideoxy-glucuronate N-acetyltransferase
MKNTPTVGIAGCGYWGQNLIRNFYELGSLSAIYDTDENRRMEASHSYDAPAASSFEQMLEMDELDGVVIATPASQHYQLAKKAILAGKDVFVEKPIALHREEGEELVELANHHRRVLMVGHLLLYHPAIRELKRLIHSGELGKIQYIYSSRLNWGKLRTEENILWSFAPHDISAILYLLHEEPTGVTASGASYLDPRVTDITLSTLEFASGVKAHIFVSWLHPFKEQKLVIIGNRKLVVFDDAAKDRKLVLYPHRIDWLDRVPVAHKNEGEVVSVPADEPLRLECGHFLECIRQRSKPFSDGESAVRVLNILEACDRSLQTSSKPATHTASGGDYFAHPTAVIDEPCVIGEGTKIWHFSHVMANSRIGSRCILGQNVHIASSVRVGNNVKIQNNVSVYEGVELEDDVFCGPSMVFTNVINPRSHVIRKDEYRPTLVRRGASLGANSTIVCGVTIGEYAFVGAGAVVTSDVPAYALVMGVPARCVGWVCRCGLRLDVADDRSICRGCGEAYHLFESALERQPTPISVGLPFPSLPGSTLRGAPRRPQTPTRGVVRKMPPSYARLPKNGGKRL